MEEQRPAGGRCPPPPPHAGRGVRACLREAAGAGEPRLASPASGANTAGPAVHLDGVACIPGPSLPLGDAELTLSSYLHSKND